MKQARGSVVRRTLSKLFLLSAGAWALGLTGCSGTYDFVTSQRFRSDPFGAMFRSEDPIMVLETNPEGDERVRAMKSLKEPLKNGGTTADQDRLIALLQTSATTDRRALCRLAAVEALSRFEDERAIPILLAAYENSPYDAPQENRAIAQVGVGNPKLMASAFTPDTVTTLQCTILESLGKHRHPQGLNLLCEVIVGTGTKDRAKVEQAGFLGEHLGPTESNHMDVRLAAIRAIGNYEGDAKAAQVLVNVMNTNKDVAIRGRAHEALVSITGQDLPPEPKAWNDWLAAGAAMRKSGLFR